VVIGRLWVTRDGQTIGCSFGLPIQQRKPVDRRRFPVSSPPLAPSGTARPSDTSHPITSVAGAAKGTETLGFARGSGGEGSGGKLRLQGFNPRRLDFEDRRIEELILSILRRSETSVA
jgi:hypothetical protein